MTTSDLLLVVFLGVFAVGVLGKLWNWNSNRCKHEWGKWTATFLYQRRYCNKCGYCHEKML